MGILLNSMEQPLGAAAVATTSAQGNICQRTRSQKYTSMFRIDGLPILPPLMTSEKRRQMAKLRERAIRVEQRLAENRRRKSNYPDSYMSVLEEMVPDDGASRSPEEDSSSNGSLSHRSIELDAQRQADDSYTLLTNLIQEHEADSGNLSMPPSNSYIDCGIGVSSPDCIGTPNAQNSETNLIERMQKLQKSETLIYDNRANTIIMPISDFESLQRRSNLRDVEEKANLNYMAVQKPLHFSMEKTLKNIPSICVDPPTPLAANRTFTENIGGNESLGGINVSESKPSMNQKSYYDELSSDESFNCAQSSTMMNKDLKAHKKVTNITGKIIKFDPYHEEGNSDKNGLKLCGMKAPQRSATSPSLKAMAEPTQTMSSLDVSRDSPQSENGLVRSNSFTLDYPSKALLEHIRQQKTRSPTGKRNTPSASATRDTVESKAKRVQKVELKSRSSPMRLQSKVSTTNIASSTSTMSYPTSNTLLFKNKRSPYESKANNKTKIARQLKKCASSTNAVKQMKPRQSMPSIQTSGQKHAHASESARNSPIGLLSEIEAEHRQRFMQLLAAQQNEQKRMQQAFEEQQQKLFEQLTAEMGNVQLLAASNGGGGGSGGGGGAEQRIYSPHSSAAAGASSENSPMTKSECSEYGLRSPTQSINSSMMSSSMCITSTAAYDMPSDMSNCSNIPAYSITSNTNRYTPRRRLFAGGEHSPGGNSASGGAHATPTSATTASRRQQQQLEETQRRNAAATKINAHVRGYLVRRLFQTEQIQRIVQTIRDTLIFVLNLHLETTQNPREANAPDNIKLKARLLQQLSSASRTLHLMLFQTSLKERMEIIARDRKRVKTKMLTLNMKRSPRIHT